MSTDNSNSFFKIYSNFRRMRVTSTVAGPGAIPALVITLSPLVPSVLPTITIRVVVIVVVVVVVVLGKASGAHHV